jgi:hypothetical protein
VVKEDYPFLTAALPLIPGLHKSRVTKFFTVARSICASCHPSDAKNFEVIRILLENLCTPVLDYHEDEGSRFLRNVGNE